METGTGGPASDHPWHAIPVEEATRTIQSDAATGLSTAEATQRIGRFGENLLPEPERRSTWMVLLGQFKSPLIYLLLLAAGVALALGHTSDAAVIAAVVVLNALIGALQEGRAERALVALRRLTTQNARLVRDGTEVIVPASSVVPGDLLLVQAGDAICADARLLEGGSLQIAEAALTGESVPVSKATAPVSPETPLSDRSNMIYAGTHVTAGRARALVVATGLATEIGHIAALTEGAKPEKTPLERRVGRFGKQVIVAAALAFVSVLVLGTLHGLPLGQVLMVGISQLVGVIPEGLPIAMTIALAIGVQRMAGRGAVVRRLSAVETLGSTTVICTDKTGTLTRNEMTVSNIHLPTGRELTVSGVGYDPAGDFREEGQTEAVDALTDPALRQLLEAGLLCNDAQLAGPHDAAPTWTPIGDPTEVALVAVAIKGGLVPADVRAHSPRRAEIPFDATTKLMATQHEEGSGSRVVVKGAPEVLLDLCHAVSRGESTVPLDDLERARIVEAARRMAQQALRVLAVAVASNAKIDESAGFSAFRGRLTLLGLFGQLDPPRVEVKDAVQRCRTAGIRTVMVTGDHKDTGRAIASALGIANEGDVAVDGSELASMSEDELEERIGAISVFARVQPAQKLRIVEALQRKGEVVAMTGDGVNDAPALAKADVGVAMGVTGTEVAKEAAKMVISDDNFASIVAAVEEGRVAYQNIKKAVLLLVSTSAAEVLVLLIAMLVGYPPPFAAVQILWNNLVTEGLITINLVMDPAEGSEMARPPIARDEPLFTRLLLGRAALMVFAIVVSTLGWFLFRTGQGVPEAQVRTETFTMLAVCEWFNVLSCRSVDRSALTFELLSNKWLLGGLLLGNLLQLAVVFWEPLGRIFHTVPFGLREAMGLAVVGSLVFWVEEGRKFVVRRRTGWAAERTAQRSSAGSRP